MKKITIVLPSDLKNRASMRARSMGISMGELVRRSLRAFLEQHEDEDPLLSDNVVFDGEAPSDYASSHDRHLLDEKGK